MIAVLAWVIAALIAAVVLSFCAYEVIWKTQRLRREAARLQGLAAALQRLQGDLAQVQQRAADAVNAGKP